MAAPLTYALECSDVNRIAMVGRDAEGLMQDFEELGRVGGSSGDAYAAVIKAREATAALGLIFDRRV